MIKASELTSSNQDVIGVTRGVIDAFIEILSSPSVVERKRERMKLYMREYRKTHPRKK